MINAKLQSIIDTKSAIGNAIVNKGGTITGETPFFNYAAQIDGISTGTPQTIFAASDGSKWALTNAVNLTNVSNNVTSDFNWWQPANNGTSDPILNVGTVNGNISGNIRIVQVNQVNIAQYGNIVATDTLGGKYVGFNGYDSQTNPTPTNTATFNRWLLNNSATGTVIFANATFTTGIYNGPNSSINEASVTFVQNSPNYGGTIRALTSNGNFVYAAGATTETIRKYHKSNLAFDSNSPSYGATPLELATNNGFIYAVGSSTNNDLRKYHEGNLAFVGNAPYGNIIYGLAINNGFIFIGGGGTANYITKYHESNLVLVGNSSRYNADITSMTINNGFVFAGGWLSEGKIKKYHESNLGFSAESPNLGVIMWGLSVNNGFVYTAGHTGRVFKNHESNLVNSANSTITNSFSARSIKAETDYVYVGGDNNGGSTGSGQIQKFYSSNLVLLAQTNNYGGAIFKISTDSNNVYAGGFGAQTVHTYSKASITPDNQTFYSITKIKE
jgi:hypothetical protein